MGMQPPQVVVNGVLNSLLKALFCRGSLTRVIVAAKIGGILARQLWIRKLPATATSHWETKPSETNSDTQYSERSRAHGKMVMYDANTSIEAVTVAEAFAIRIRLWK
ncbi:hypothetical protein Tco_1167183 [Tanacetum coccineum]